MIGAIRLHRARAVKRFEFFAVATETYFKTPDVLRRRNPELFRILEGYYGPLPRIRPHPDPEPGKRRPDESGPAGRREPTSSR